MKHNNRLCKCEVLFAAAEGRKERRKGKEEEDDLYTHTGMHATSISLYLHKKKKGCCTNILLSIIEVFYLPPLRASAIGVQRLNESASKGGDYR